MLTSANVLTEQKEHRPFFTMKWQQWGQGLFQRSICL